MRRLPVGFRFEPTDDELFYYLRRKVKGQPLPYDILPEYDLYGDKEPWKIFDKNLKGNFYVFTKLKKKSKSRIERMAGCGTWDGRNSHDLTDHNDNVVGFDKYFVFEVDENLTTNTEDNGHWIMHEFSIIDEEYVICVIRNKDSSKKTLEGENNNTADEREQVQVQIQVQVRATKPRAKKQGNDSSSTTQRSKKRNLNPGQKNEKQKKDPTTSTMDNIDVEEKNKSTGDPCLLPSNLISEPIKIQEHEASSSNFNYISDNQFDEEDIMASCMSLTDLITEPDPLQFMGATSSSHNYYTGYEFVGKDMMDPCMIEAHLTQSSLFGETVPTLECRPMMLAFQTPNRGVNDAEFCWVDQQTSNQVSENMLPHTNIGSTAPVNTNFQN